MLAPETWSFKAPDSSFQCEKQQVNNNKYFQTIQNLPFNHLVSVVLPNTLHTPEKVGDLLHKDCEYYTVSNISLDELTTRKFVNHFIEKGALTVISINNRVDVDDCVCIRGDGLMVLSLQKESYERCGIEGTVSCFYSKSKQRYIVYINLLSNTFKPGSKSYEKTKQSLRRLQKFSLIISWKPPQDSICPSTIAKYFFDLKYDVKLCVPEYDVRTKYSVQVPILENVDEFTEWLGMFSLETTLEHSDNYLTNYEVPHPYQQCAQVKYLQSKGFFTCDQIKSLAEALMKFTENEDVPWVSLYVQGFSDSAIGWNARENNYYTNADNSYVLIITSENYWIVRQSSSRKCYK